MTVGRNLDSIFDQLRAELAPATIVHNEHSAVPMNDFRDYVLVRRVSGDAICELPKREPVVVFHKSLKNLVENTIWIKHHVYAPFFSFSATRVETRMPMAIVVAASTVAIRDFERNRDFASTMLGCSGQEFPLARHFQASRCEQRHKEPAFQQPHGIQLPQRHPRDFAFYHSNSAKPSHPAQRQDVRLTTF